ncbi:MAG: PD-(D/E)XK nuclease family protein [Candidatus Thermoplasmatota archaeon]|nr:PD-(D/E)XK nuclease family protein [Candidatus Thermoplasmatota archaeon]
MPVNSAEPEDNSVNPYRRLSASQMVTWQACPRLWYYNYIPKLRGPLPPQIIRGNAAESCISKVLRDSPSMVPANSDNLLKSPILDDGSPAYQFSELWPAPSLLPLDSSDWPSTRGSLEEWALARAEAHFQSSWDSAVIDWESISNRTGSSDGANEQECREMVANGIRMHIDQVEACMKAGGGPHAEEWRSGKHRHNWPAPDGFPRVWEEPHPCAQETGSEISWCEAWELARPWFVDPDAGSFTQTTSHPEGWFQGEYDLVYRWTGKPSIIDIKASKGKGDRSGGYLEQLRLYAWLWWETHDRTEEVESLGIWYLGPGSVKDVPLPTSEELHQYGSDLKEVYELIHAKDPQIEDCPAEPAPLRYFDEGGKPSKNPVDSNPLARCINCDVRGVCENGNHDLDLPLEDRIERFGHAWPITHMGELKTRVDATGIVSELRGPRLQEDDTIELSFKLLDGYDRAKVRPSRYGAPSRVTRSISNDCRVIVENAIPSVWRGEMILELDEKSSISLAGDDDSEPIVEIETRTSIVGRIWSVDAFPTGAGVSRWSVTLLDKSGSVGAVAFKQFIPVTAASMGRGDEIAILNGEVGEFNGRPQVRIGPNTRVVPLRSSDDLPDY